MMKVFTDLRFKYTNLLQLNRFRISKIPIYLADIAKGDRRGFIKNSKDFKSKPREIQYVCSKRKLYNCDKTLCKAVINLIRVSVSHWKNSTHFKDMCKYNSTTEILYSKESEGTWIQLENVYKFSAIIRSLFIKAS